MREGKRVGRGGRGREERERGETGERGERGEGRERGGKREAIAILKFYLLLR